MVNYATSREEAERVVAEIAERAARRRGTGGRLEGRRVEHLFAETKKAYGTLDILVNNAGVYEFAPLEGVTPEIPPAVRLNVSG